MMKKDLKNDFKLQTNLSHLPSSPSSSSSLIYSNNKMSDCSLKHSKHIVGLNQNLINYFHASNNTAIINYNVVERKLKTKLELFPTMYSIQENVDYDLSMKSPKITTNYRNKQTKYLLNFTQNKFHKKRKPFNYMNSGTHNQPTLNYFYGNEENETNRGNGKLSLYRSPAAAATTTTTMTMNTTYTNSSSSSTTTVNRTFYKRSDYGRFKRSKDCGPSLSDVPMNVNFNTLNPSCTSNRYHILTFEQVKLLNEIMNSSVSIAPKPIFQTFLGTNIVKSTKRNPSSPILFNKPCSCFCTEYPVVYDLMKRTCTKSSNHPPFDCSSKSNSLNVHDNKIGDHDDAVTSSVIPTTERVSESDKLLTSIPVCSSNNETNKIGIENTINNCCLHSHQNTVSHTSMSPTSQQPCQLPIIRIQLKKLIRTIRDRLLEESVPIKEIHLKGGVASSVIIGLQNEQKFHELELIFYVDLCNSTSCTKIKSVVFSSIANILTDTINLNNLSNLTNNCEYCYNHTLPFNISSTQTTQISPTSCYCTYCSCCTLNKSEGSFNLNKENLGNLNRKDTMHNIDKAEQFISNISTNESLENRQPLHENQSNNFPYPNAITKNQSEQKLPKTNECYIPDDKQTIKCTKDFCRSQHSFCNLHSFCFNNYPFVLPLFCPICSRPFNSSNQHNTGQYKSSEFNQKKSNSMINSYNDLIIKQYIQKMIRVFKPTCKTSDSWCSFSIGYHTLNEWTEKIIDLKFIDRMHRQFEFTVDSFHIALDSLLTFYDSSKNYLQQMNENFYPIVVAQSVAGSFLEALTHLTDHTIVTHRPEEIYGGGLLKYCKLLVEGYKPSEMIDVALMEKYMCSRFFIDFPDIMSQYHQLNYFMMNYLENNLKIKANYLNILYEVVSHSTICLMTHERQQTLCLIQMFLRDVSEQENENKRSVVHLQEFLSKDWALDKVFYGTNYFPKEMYSINDCQEFYELHHYQCQAGLIKNANEFNDQQQYSTNCKIKLHDAKEDEHVNNADDGNDTSPNKDDNNHNLLTTESSSEEKYMSNNNSIEETVKTNDNLERNIEHSTYIQKIIEDNENAIQVRHKVIYSNQETLSVNSCPFCAHHIHPQFCQNHFHRNHYYQNSHNHHHHHHDSCHFNNEMYYLPQLVTYFPVNEYLISLFTNKNQGFYSVPYGITAYKNNANNTTNNITANDNHSTTTNFFNKLPHYHAKIILPQEINAERITNENMRYYVGVPSSYRSNIICSKYPLNNNDNNSNHTVQTREDMLTYCSEPFIYYGSDQNYYIYPTSPLSTL
ncbi:unnamed protein product [Schistosoma turkestanicum]|nr:unnamed protein product [Schistosoma turkestanicum]